MRLDQALVSRALCESRNEAQVLIASSKVLLNGEVCTKQAKHIIDSDTLMLLARRPYVGRGGEKLAGVLHDYCGGEQAIQMFCKDKVALDIGSSTGGFTDCLLQYGVVTVVAVDVGTSQMHHSLINHPSVEIHENTDIRDFVSDRFFDIVVADLSFIALEKVLDKILSFAHRDTTLFLLIKPQFEVGFGNTKKGIVKDKEIVSALLARYETLTEKLGYTAYSFPCHIEGGDGNQEHFLVLKKA